MRKTIYFLILSVVLAGCHKAAQQLDERILWHTTFIGEDFAHLAGVPVIDGNLLFLSRVVVGLPAHETAVMAWDIEKNELAWTWHEIKAIGSLGYGIPFEFSEMKILDGVLYGKDHNQLVAINTENGQTLWKLSFPGSISFGFEPNGQRILVLTNTMQYMDRISIYEIETVSGQAREIFSKDAWEPDHQVKAFPFVLYIDDNGTLCASFGTIHKINGEDDDYDGISHFLKVDLDKGQLVYDQILPNPSGMHDLVFWDGKIYGHGHYLVEINEASGKIVRQWKQDARTWKGLSVFEYPYMYLMQNNLTNRLTKITLDNHKILWKGSLKGHQGLSLISTKQHIYTMGADAKLYVIDKLTGELKEIREGPFLEENEALEFQNILVIDPLREWLFMFDYAHLICYDLNL